MTTDTFKQLLLRMPRFSLVDGLVFICRGLDWFLKKTTQWAHIEPFYRKMARVVLHILYDLEYIDFDKIPVHGAAILVSNHVSYMDGILINAGIKRNVRFVVEKNIFKAPLVHYFMQINRSIPIAPTKADVGNALDLISQGLENAHMVCIFPEGQLTYTGNLGRFRPGIEWIVNRNPCPVYPIAIQGLWGSVLSRKYQKSRFRFWPRFFRMHIRIKCGEPIPPEMVKIDHLQKIIMDLKRGLVEDHS